VTRPLFEQYKEALRKGHLAVRAGALDEALVAYHEAARLAPDRAAPHTSTAVALHASGRHDEAHAAYVRALSIAPDDEATLRARAAAYKLEGRNASAAADLEHLAEALAAMGRRSEALEAARNSVALTATASRRRLVERLEAPEAEAAVPPPVRPVAARPVSAAATRPVPASVPAPAPVAAPAPRARAPEPETSQLAPDEDEGESAPGTTASGSAAPVERPPDPWNPRQPTIVAEPEAVFEPAPAPESELPTEPSIPWPAIDLPSAPPPMLVGPPPNVEFLMSEAHALIDGGDPRAARNLMLTAVAVHRAAGRSDAALDVCLQLLALAPGDAHVHLAIAGLQLDRGWNTLATEKIVLLLRLTALTGDTQAEADVHALAAERLRDEPPAGFARH
jgi:tetratricopeptide (TPR) repeat protein